MTIPGELRALMQETAKMLIHANEMLERAVGGIAVMHADLVEPTIRLKDCLMEDFRELAEISGKIYDGQESQSPSL